MRSFPAGLAVALLALALLALAPLAPSLSAQTEAGLMGGATFATLSGDDVPNVERRTGFLAGAFLRLPLGRVLTFQPEVAWVRKGARLDEGAGFETALRLDYVEVPFLLLVRAPTAGLSLYGLAGPTVAFEIACREELSGPGELALDRDCADADDGEGDDRRSIETGLMVGAGVDLPLGVIALTLSGRYTWGLESIFEDRDVKHRTIAAVAGVRFPIGG